MKCLVCGTEDQDKPQIFKNEEWCSDNHRKVVKQEVPPTKQELDTMDQWLFDKIIEAADPRDPFAGL